MSIDLKPVTIRTARAADADALRLLAELDGGPVPGGRVLVAEVDGELVAAMPVAGGPAIADPFLSTSALVSLLLGLRAAQARDLDDRRKFRGRMRRLFPAAGPRRRQIRTRWPQPRLAA